MAAKYGKLTVSATAQTIGDAKGTAVAQEFVFQCPSTNSGITYIAVNGDTAVADKGFCIEAGKDVSSKDLPAFMKQGPFSVIGTASDVLYYTFSKSRG